MTAEQERDEIALRALRAVRGAVDLLGAEENDETNPGVMATRQARESVVGSEALALDAVNEYALCLNSVQASGFASGKRYLSSGLGSQNL